MSRVVDSSKDSRTLWDDLESNVERDERTESKDDATTLRVYSPYEIADDVLLSTVDGVGPLTTERLVDYFGSATEVLKAPVGELCRVEKVGAKLAAKIRDARNACDIDALVNFCVVNDVQIVALFDARYPARLREIANPPRLIYVRGEILEQDRRAIAIVGTRDATPYGRAQATRLARELSESGFTIVSGLALGIDGCAHRAALDAGGRTLAALGSGVVKIYPREHEDLAARVMRSGALISEYHPLCAPLAGNFPARNRIISGLSIGTLVVESAKRGGALVTARFAAEQNREVFAVPGPVDQPTSQGCHQLLREGAALVESVDDVIEALPVFERPTPRDIRRNEIDGREVGGQIAPGSLGIAVSALDAIDTRRDKKTKKAPSKSARKESEKSEETPPRPLPPLSEDERRLVEAIGDAPKSIDLAIRESGLSASRVVGLIASLELKKVLRRLEGALVERLHRR